MSLNEPAGLSCRSSGWLPNSRTVRQPNRLRVPPSVALGWQDELLMVRGHVFRLLPHFRGARPCSLMKGPAEMLCAQLIKGQTLHLRAPHVPIRRSLTTEQPVRQLVR
jgi:hypothetical protein